MPFFDFKCEKCGHEFSLRISNQEKANVKCPECGHPQVRQLFSPFFTKGTKIDLNTSFSSPSTCGGCSQAGTG